MSFFNSILNKLGFGSAQAAEPTDSTPTATPQPLSETPAPEQPASVAITVVDVVSQLEALAKNNPQKLNWRTSIVDLMKLLELDSSLGARKELAGELGCPAQLMADSAQMNMWLHKTVLNKLAENGGNIPADLLG